MRDETRALGGLLDADGAVELAFDHRLAIHVGDFDLAALPGELHVAPRADDVDVAAGLLNADVAAGVADLDLAAPAVGGDATGKAGDLYGAAVGPEVHTRPLRHMHFQIHLQACTLALRPHLVAIARLDNGDADLLRVPLCAALIRFAHRLLHQDADLRGLLGTDGDVAAVGADRDARVGRNGLGGNLFVERIGLCPGYAHIDPIRVLPEPIDYAD